MGNALDFGTNPNTGVANNPGGQLWQGITGKSGPTAPQLPQGFGWLAPVLQSVGQTAARNIGYGPSNAASAAGQLGTAGQAGIAGGLDVGGINDLFNSSIGGIGTGAATGFLPSTDAIDALLRPSLDRSFERGAAEIREQNALTGNLSSTGASQQIADYRGGLESTLDTNVANIYGSLLPQSMNIRSDLSKFGATLPGVVSGSVYGPLADQGLNAQQFPLQALGLATGAIGGAPFYARQGSTGNGAIPALISAYFGGGGKGGAAAGGARAGR